MTADEIAYGVHESLAAVEESRAALQKMLSGKRVSYYHGNFFIADRVGISGVNLYVSGPLVKKNGDPHKTARGSMRYNEAKFSD